MKKILYIVAIVSMSFFAVAATPTAAFAHVVVSPNKAGVSAYQTFTMEVPSEKASATNSLRLLIPKGLNSVIPNVKPGWTITLKKSSEGDAATVTEIDWTGGSIPAGQRDEFLFSAQVPAKPTTIVWKAYQIYDDGTVVSWDKMASPNMTDAERETMEKKNIGPASQTTIVNDLTGSAQNVENAKTASSTNSSLSLAIALVALVLALVSLAKQSGKK